MSAFYKVLEAMQNRPQNGHALANTQNIEILTKAKKDIQEMLR